MNADSTMSRRGLLAGVPAIAVAAVPAVAAAVPVAITAAPKSIDAMLEGVDRKVKRQILDVIFGWLGAHEDAKTGAPDPVFAAIEAHKHAMEEVRVKAVPVTRLVVPDPDDEEALSEACDNERETLLDFLLTEPTTIAGALAALEFASSPIFPETEGVVPPPVLAPAFTSGDTDLIDVAAEWPAMIARHVRRLIETHAMLGTVAFGPTVVKG
jgi:hypothetical protein